MNRSPATLFVQPVQESEAGSSELGTLDQGARWGLRFDQAPNFFSALGSNPSVTRAIWLLFRQIVHEGELPRVVKEMVGAAAPAVHGSEFALKVHLHSLSVLGVSAELLQALQQFLEALPWPPREQAVLRFARTVALDPKYVPLAEIAPLAR